MDAKAREKLTEALGFVPKGDTLVVTRLDRLARSIVHFLEITQELERKGVRLRILDISSDTATSQGRLMLNLLSSIAQFEGETMPERQLEPKLQASTRGESLPPWLKLIKYVL